VGVQRGCAQPGGELAPEIFAKIRCNNRILEEKRDRVTTKDLAVAKEQRDLLARLHEAVLV
jgi:hypothetical protein